MSRAQHTCRSLFLGFHADIQMKHKVQVGSTWNINTVVQLNINALNIGSVSEGTSLLS